MAGELNNVATADGYTKTATAKAPGSVTLRMFIRNAAVLYQLDYGQAGGGEDWQPAAGKFMLPGDRSLDESHRPFNGVRFKSATAGVPARVTVDCIQRHG